VQLCEEVNALVRNTCSGCYTANMTSPRWIPLWRINSHCDPAKGGDCSGCRPREEFGRRGLRNIGASWVEGWRQVRRVWEEGCYAERISPHIAVQLRNSNMPLHYSLVLVVVHLIGHRSRPLNHTCHHRVEHSANGTILGIDCSGRCCASC
jgi:hypothetical protein